VERFVDIVKAKFVLECIEYESLKKTTRKLLKQLSETILADTIPQFEHYMINSIRPKIISIGGKAAAQRWQPELLRCPDGGICIKYLARPRHGTI